MTSYRLKTVRLINFHNFVDVEIPVRGHLFMVGDNASGKTTVLDAVQWVLSGGQDLEFNAAAQLWGARQDGRTLRGAVSRTQLERGPLRQGRTITYAALELENDEGELLSLGLGAELAHPEAQLQTWGFLVPGPLCDIPLLHQEEGADVRPLTKEELRDRLGGDRVFLQIGRYQKFLADKFTRGEESFKRLTEFWKISKAYKQMAEKTRDYSELLRHMLPKPDGEAFQQVRRGLSDLASVEDRLGGLRAQRDYLEKLRQGLIEVGHHREAILRYSWLAAHRAREMAREKEAEAHRALAVVEREIQEAERALAVAQTELNARENERQDLRARDEEGLLERRERLVCEEAESRRVLDESQRLVEERSIAVARSSKRLTEARRELSRELAFSRQALADTVAEVGPGLGHYLDAMDRVVTDETPERAWAELDARSARQEIENAQSETNRAFHETVSSFREAQSLEERWKKTLEDLERLPDALPNVPRYEDFLHRLEQEDLHAVPLYRCVEKAVGADDSLFRDLEVALGERALAALVPEPQDAARVVRLALEEFPGIPVVRTDLPPAPAVPWLESLVDWDRLSDEAKGALRRLAEAGSTPGLCLEGGGVVEDRGLKLKGVPLPSPLLGADARREARRQQREDARLKREEARERCARLASERDSLQERTDRWRRVLTLLSETREGDFPRRAQEGLQAADADGRSRESLERARDTVTVFQSQAEQSLRALETLRARLANEGLENLDTLLASAERALADARDREREALEKRGEWKGAMEHARENILSKQEERMLCEADADEWARPLMDVLPEEHKGNLEGYVLDVRQGRRMTRVDNIREKIREVERAYAMAVARLEGDGGVLHPEYGGLFGLTYEESAHRILHRNGQALDVFLEGFSAQVKESEDLLDTKRRSLFEEVIQGHLARKLQREITDLEQTVREVDRLLKVRVFGRRTRYRIRFHPRPEHAHFISVIKRLASFDAAGQEEFRTEIRERLASLPVDVSELPETFDYRHWYEFQLLMAGQTEEGVPLQPKVARLGSGGEQAVPKYIIILAMASLLFRASESSLRVLLFDEVFYGIDKARREELLTLATEMDFQLIVASPEQAGDRESYRKATTAFVVKDAQDDVHVVPAHVWTDRPADLFLSEESS